MRNKHVLCGFVSSCAQCCIFFSVREREILSTWSLVGSMWGRTRHGAKPAGTGKNTRKPVAKIVMSEFVKSNWVTLITFRRELNRSTSCPSTVVREFTRPFASV